MSVTVAPPALTVAPPALPPQGFICAEVMAFEELKEAGSEGAVKAKGRYRQARAAGGGGTYLHPRAGASGQEHLPRAGASGSDLYPEQERSHTSRMFMLEACKSA